MGRGTCRPLATLAELSVAASNPSSPGMRLHTPQGHAEGVQHPRGSSAAHADADQAHPGPGQTQVSNNRGERVQEGGRVGEKVRRELLQHRLMKAPTREWVWVGRFTDGNAGPPRCAPSCPHCCSTPSGLRGARARPQLARAPRPWAWPARAGAASLSGRGVRALAPHAHAQLRPRDGGPRGVPEAAEGRECGRRARVSAGTGAGARPHGL